MEQNYVTVTLCIRGSFGSHESASDGISIRSSVFAQLTSVFNDTIRYEMLF